MPLRLVNRERTHKITVSDTVFEIVSMTIGEKETLLYKIANPKEWASVENAGRSFAALLDLIAPVIAKIEGHDDVRKTLDQIEDTAQLKEIINALINHCGLSESESKNSLSLSEQAIPESMGSVEKPVVPEDEPASTIPTEGVQY